jgi:hypothetical protein
LGAKDAGKSSRSGIPWGFLQECSEGPLNWIVVEMTSELRSALPDRTISVRPFAKENMPEPVVVPTGMVAPSIRLRRPVELPARCRTEGPFIRTRINQMGEGTRIYGHKLPPSLNPV